MWFYIFLLLFVIVLSGRYVVTNETTHLVFKSRQDIALKFSYLLLTLVGVCRYDVGWDYPEYLSFVYPKLDLDKVESIELIPRVFAKISEYVNFPFLFFILIGLFTYFFIFSTFEKYSTSKYESLIIYLCVFYFDSFGIIRQAFAYALVFYGVKYIKNKQFFSYLFICLLAFFIHRSSVVAILIFFLYHYCKFIPTLILSCLGVILKKIVLDRIILFNMYSYYLNKLDDYQGGGKIQFFFIVVLLFLIFMSKFTKNYKENEKYFSILVVGALLPFIFGASLGGRLALYFNVYLCLAWPSVMRRFKISTKVIFLFIFYIYFIFFLFVSIQNPIKSPFTPYRLFFLTDLTHLK